MKEIAIFFSGYLIGGVVMFALFRHDWKAALLARVRDRRETLTATIHNKRLGARAERHANGYRKTTKIVQQ